MIKFEHLTTQHDILNALCKDNLIDNLLNDVPFNDLMNLDIVWFRVHQDKDAIGVFIVNEFSPNVLCVHGGLYKEFRGKKESHKFLQECINMIRNESKCSFVIQVKKDNIPVIKCIEKAGFKFKQELNNNMMLFEEVV